MRVSAYMRMSACMRVSTRRCVRAMCTRDDYRADSNAWFIDSQQSIPAANLAGESAAIANAWLIVRVCATLRKNRVHYRRMCTFIRYNHLLGLIIWIAYTLFTWFAQDYMHRIHIHFAIWNTHHYMKYTELHEIHIITCITRTLFTWSTQAYTYRIHLHLAKRNTHHYTTYT